MAHVALIGVPFDGYGRPGNQAAAAAALRHAGIAGAFAGHVVDDDGDLELPAGEVERGPSALINETALVAAAAQLRAAIPQAVDGGRFPVVFGGDCSALLGIVPGLAANGPVGLLHVDGHQDTMPLDVSEDGEAANTEIGLLLGLTGRTLQGPLAEGLPALTADALALLGPRDATWRRRFNTASLADLGVFIRDDRQIAVGPAAAATAAVDHVRAAADRWWLHLDLDVLDPSEFPAQGLPHVPDEPGGLSVAELTELLDAAVRRGGCAGLSVAIYDPDQDPGGADAKQVVELLRTVAAALPSARPGC